MAQSVGFFFSSVLLFNGILSAPLIYILFCSTFLCLTPDFISFFFFFLCMVFPPLGRLDFLGSFVISMHTGDTTTVWVSVLQY